MLEGTLSLGGVSLSQQNQNTLFIFKMSLQDLETKVTWFISIPLEAQHVFPGIWLCGMVWLDSKVGLDDLGDLPQPKQFYDSAVRADNGCVRNGKWGLGDDLFSNGKESEFPGKFSIGLGWFCCLGHEFSQPLRSGEDECQCSCETLLFSASPRPNSSFCWGQSSLWGARNTKTQRMALPLLLEKENAGGKSQDLAPLCQSTFPQRRAEVICYLRPSHPWLH